MNRQASKFHPIHEEDYHSSSFRACDHPGCTARGEYRAPKSRDALNDYYWFCLDHVREYNQAWDYFAGFKPEDIEAIIRSDTTWQRPTWPLGHMPGGHHYISSENTQDPFDLFSDDLLRRPARRSTLSPAEEAAMKVMDLKEPLTLEGLKTRYKELCKRHHPDANGGDKASEERFKQIGQAYNTLMESLNP